MQIGNKEDVGGMLEETRKMLANTRRKAGIDYEKVQTASLEILEVARENNLNSAEFKETLKLSHDALNYSLSRLSANAWVSTAAEKAKE